MDDKKPKRLRGTGRVYKPPGSRFYWIQYYSDGKKVRESSRSENEKAAEKMLRQRLSQIDAGVFVGPRVERVTVAELDDDYARAFEVSGQRAIQWVRRCWDKHLEPFFGKLRARQVTTALLNDYVLARRAKGAAIATCVRELACLRAAFNVALKGEKISHVPHFPTLTEDNVRTGFVEYGDYQKLTAQNPPLYMRLLLALGFTFGFRKGELMAMRAGQIDLLGRTIRLNPGTTKSREGRLVSFEGLTEIEALLQQAMSGKSPEAWLFTRDGGKRVRSFREAPATLAIHRAGRIHVRGHRAPRHFTVPSLREFRACRASVGAGGG